jgi:hypothetical protein
MPAFYWSTVSSNDRNYTLNDEQKSDIVMQLQTGTIFKLDSFVKPNAAFELRFNGKARFQEIEYTVVRVTNDERRRILKLLSQP